MVCINRLILPALYMLVLCSSSVFSNKDSISDESLSNESPSTESIIHEPASNETIESDESDIHEVWKDDFGEVDYDELRILSGKAYSDEDETEDINPGKLYM